MRIDIEIICPMCGEIHSVEVDLMQYKAWRDGEVIQRAMPQLSATEREQLISHLCSQCQTLIFGSDDDEEDYDADHLISTEILNMLLNYEFPHFAMDIEFIEDED